MKRLISLLGMMLVLIPSLVYGQTPQKGAPFFATAQVYWADAGTRIGFGFDCGYQNIPASAKTPIHYDVRAYEATIVGSDTILTLKWDTVGIAIAGVDATGTETRGPSGELNIIYSASEKLFAGRIYVVAVLLSNDSGSCELIKTTRSDAQANWLGVKSLSGTRCAVFPTLFSNSLTISSEEDISLTVIDMSGKQIVSQKVLVGNTQIPTTEIPNGNYVAYLTSSSGTKVVKISK